MTCLHDIRLGPRQKTEEEILERGLELAKILTKASRRDKMHYRNGREAKNGDKVVQLDSNGKLAQFGVIFDAVPGNDYCNGNLAPVHGVVGACMVDCLHVDDVAEFLKEKGLDKRPTGK
jgi:hypothetical protein